ncbi:hypothetical protein FAP59_18835 [Morganella morganii]|nr:hypothetical protein [Morganella morganii]HCT8187719.1 hypothetical protein [Morganella morganii]
MSKKKRNTSSKVKNSLLAIMVSLLFNVAEMSDSLEINFVGNHLFTFTVINGNVVNGDVIITTLYPTLEQ